eukprot:scaffold1167_cov418-Prasinococcus_capsulatus_cf.AAC.33
MNRKFPRPGTPCLEALSCRLTLPKSSLHRTSAYTGHKTWTVSRCFGELKSTNNNGLLSKPCDGVRQQLVMYSLGLLLIVLFN